MKSRMRLTRTLVETSLSQVGFLKEQEAVTLTTNTKLSYNKCFSRAPKQAATFLYRQKTIN